jgi:hypothetical protein
MRRLKFLGLATLTLWAGAALSAATIAITNPSFEADNLAPGGIQNSAPFGWADFLGNGLAGAWHPDAAYFNLPVPDGNSVLFVSYLGTASRARQTLDAVLEANTLYTLTYYVGRRLDLPLNAYAVMLTAGGGMIASDSGGNPTAGNFVMRSFSFATGEFPDGLGTILGIDVDAAGQSPNGGQAVFDAFSLTAVSTLESGAPEPSTFFLMGGAMLAAAGWSRRRRRI